MDIVVHSLGMPFNGETIAKRSLGGSESAAYYQARELARRGHRVTVFTSSTEEGHWDGVNYCFTGQPTNEQPLGERFEFYARNTPHDVLIIQRHPAGFHGQFASKVNLWQLHDLALHRTSGMANHNMWQVDAVTCVSEWHKNQVCEVYGFDPEFVRVVPNGVDPSLYQSSQADTDAWIHDDRYESVKSLIYSRKFLMLYQSRPERGLEHLVRPGGIMDRLRDTNAHLLVCGYDNTTGPMVNFYGLLHRWADALPNVTMLGALTKPQLAALQESCGLLCYPSEFEETSCMTAMEAMHAGLPMLASDVGALSETCKDSGTHFVSLKDGRADEDSFVGNIRFWCSAHHDKQDWQIQEMQQDQINAAQTRTWSAAVDRLEEVIAACFEKRKGTRAAALRHCIEHSDVVDGVVLPLQTEPNAIVTRTANEIAELYRFVESPEAYAAHYDKHQGAYYDDHESKVIGEDVTRTSRFQGVGQLLEREIAIAGNELRVMDYGCAHGHYMMPLAKAFPSCRFTGVDVSERAIAAATKWALRDQVTNVEMRLGGQEVFDDLSTLCPLMYDEDSIEYDGNAVIAKKAHRDLFDVIIAGEVVEHVPDYHALLESFRNVLKPGGLLIVTTPYGRWEWTGTEAFREAREHLHHFERQDIVELCGRNEAQILYAPAGNDKTGKAMGSWVWAVRPLEPFGEIDVERKRTQLCPRETLSACMIVKDGEKTLRKCVESFIDWVDEVVIAVDPKTKDRTREVIDQLKADFRWKPFTVIPGLNAIEHGFDEARNRSIDTACGDWILWVDADEEVQKPWNLWKYLRPSHHRAYGFPQLHYSADPDQVLTTDYPCRLFRNRCGIKFYGCLTPDTEVTTNPGVKQLSDVQVGDMVRTHDGSYRKVTKRWAYDVEADMVNVKAVGLPLPIKLTLNHEMLAINTKKCHYDKEYNVRCKETCRRDDCPHRFYEHYSPEWKRAEQIEVGDLLVYPIDRSEEDVPLVSISKHAKLRRQSGRGSSLSWRLRDGVWTSGSGRKLLDELPVSGGLLRLAGYYVSDGCISEGGRLVIYFGAHESEYADDVVAYLASIGIPASVRKARGMQIVQMRCRPLTEWMQGEFGSGSHAKKAPLWVMRLPVERQREYLRGLWRGDGCVSGSLIRYTTVNRELAAQVRDLLLRDNIVANFQWGKKSKSYSLFARVKRRKFLDWDMPSDGADVPAQAWADDRYVYHRVKSVNVTRYKGQVMDLTVEGNHSYVANGAAVHNCVHEHPEIEPGKAIPRAAIRHDVKFLHNGYVDEEIRRQRYIRNLPLLHRDLEKYPMRGLNRFLWLRDIAQGLMFEHEQTKGVILEGQRERALEGVKLWEQIVEKDPIRMCMDSLRYYSHCVETLGEGFEADVSYRVAKQTAPDLACNTQFKGRFQCVDHYSKLMRKLEQEATRHYESKYL